ncbi:MAG: small multi-drug export protein [Candidatus Magasanikbacteria bacterium]|nr:small multi-drug export protein [Candidatus Magasanikbacteria bacterium]
MAQTFVAWFSAFPPEIATLLMAMVPVAERIALPVAIAVFKLPIWLAFLLVIVGNMVPIFIILSVSEKFHAWVSAHALFGKHWVRVINHIQKKFARYEKYGLIGLFLFLSIPTPVNGAFTAAFIAFLLGFKKQHALPYLFAGVVVYNVVILVLTVGLDKIF